MGKRRQYYGLDVLKVVMAVLVAGRHMIQVFYASDSRWRLLVGSWLSNLAVPVFFIIAGFLLFRKVGSPAAWDRADGAERKRGDSRRVLGYCLRILKLYVLWCVIYWPIDIYNWYHGTAGVKETVLHYIQSFFFSSTIAQLWYLPALIVACLLVWFCYSRRMHLWLILAVTAALFVAGCIGDNWYFNQQLPMKLQTLLAQYIRWFLTMRNGVFYGSFYVCLGLFLARKRKHMPFLLAVIGAVVSAGLMYLEVKKCSITNMSFFAAPAAYFLFEAAMGLNLRERKLYPRLRSVSEWVYLSHFYFFYFFSWTAKLYPYPLTERNIALTVFVPMLIFAWCMACLGEREKFGWVRKMI